MTAALVLGQNVNLSGKFVMAMYRTWLAQTLSTLDLSSLNTTQQSTDVITSLSAVKKLTEHFDTGYNSLTGIFMNTNDLNFVVQVQSTTLYSTSSNSTTTSNGEYVLYRHQERLICFTNRIWNPGINCIHQFHDLIAPWSHWIFQSLQSGTLDDRSIIAWELVLVQQFTDFHVY